MYCIIFISNVEYFNNVLIFHHFRQKMGELLTELIKTLQPDENVQNAQNLEDANFLQLKFKGFATHIQTWMKDFKSKNGITNQCLRQWIIDNIKSGEKEYGDFKDRVNRKYPPNCRLYTSVTRNSENCSVYVYIAYLEIITKIIKSNISGEDKLALLVIAFLACVRYYGQTNVIKNRHRSHKDDEFFIYDLWYIEHKSITWALSYLYENILLKHGKCYGNLLNKLFIQLYFEDIPIGRYGYKSLSFYLVGLFLFHNKSIEQNFV